MSSVFFAKSLRIFCAEAAGHGARPARLSRVPAKLAFTGQLGRRLAYDAPQGAWGGCGVATCGRRPIGKYQRKSPRRISPRGLLKIFAMMALCQ